MPTWIFTFTQYCYERGILRIQMETENSKSNQYCLIKNMYYVKSGCIFSIRLLLADYEFIIVFVLRWMKELIRYVKLKKVQGWDGIWTKRVLGDKIQPIDHDLLHLPGDSKRRSVTPRFCAEDGKDGFTTTSNQRNRLLLVRKKCQLLNFNPLGHKNTGSSAMAKGSFIIKPEILKPEMAWASRKRTVNCQKTMRPLNHTAVYVQKPNIWIF